MDTLPWYRSTIIIGALVSALSKILVLTGVISALSPEDEQVLTNTLVLLGGGIGDLVAIVARWRQKEAPQIVHRTGKDGGLRCAPFAVLAALGVVLLLGGCMTANASASPSQRLYEAYGKYVGIKEAAAAYVISPFAKPAAVRAIKSIKDQAVPAENFVRCYAAGGVTATVEGVDCTLFVFSDGNLSAYAMTLRDGFARMTIQLGGKP